MCLHISTVKILISLQQFDKTLFDSHWPFSHRIYFMKSLSMQFLLQLKWDLLITLYAYLLPYEDLHIITSINWSVVWRRYWPFWPRIFHQNVCKQMPRSSALEASMLPIMPPVRLGNLIRQANFNWILNMTLCKVLLCATY